MEYAHAQEATAQELQNSFRQVQEGRHQQFSLERQAQMQKSSGVDSCELAQEAKGQAAYVDKLAKNAIDLANGFFMQWFFMLVQILLMLDPQILASNMPGTTPVHRAMSFDFNAAVLEGFDDGDLFAMWHAIRCLIQVKFKTSEKSHSTDDLMKSILYHIELAAEAGGCSCFLFVYVFLFLKAPELVTKWRKQQLTGQLSATDEVLKELREVIITSIKKDYAKHISGGTDKKQYQAEQQQAECPQAEQQQQPHATSLDEGASSASCTDDSTSEDISEAPVVGIDAPDSVTRTELTSNSGDSCSTHDSHETEIKGMQMVTATPRQTVQVGSASSEDTSRSPGLSEGVRHLEVQTELGEKSYNASGLPDLHVNFLGTHAHAYTKGDSSAVDSETTPTPAANALAYASIDWISTLRQELQRLEQDSKGKWPELQKRLVEHCLSQGSPVPQLAQQRSVNL